jgi:hypothetical protein
MSNDELVTDRKALGKTITLVYIFVNITWTLG